MLVLLVAGNSMADPPLALKLLATHTNLRPDYTASVHEGRFIFSEFDGTGKAKRIVEMQPSTGARMILVEGTKDGKFVAENDNYLVYLDDVTPAAAKELHLQDKNTGLWPASIRLADGAEYGIFIGETLHVVQNRGARTQQVQIVELSLPHLKLQRSWYLDSNPQLLRFGESWITADDKYVIVRDGNYRFKHGVRLERGHTNNRWCHVGDMVHLGNQVVFHSMCNRIYTYDPVGNTLTHRLTLEGEVDILVSVGGYLLAMKRYSREPPKDVAALVIDPVSWLVVDTVQIYGDMVFVHGGHLVTFDRIDWRHSEVKVYEVLSDRE